MKRSERGAALIEAALVSLFFFMFLFGFIDYSSQLRAMNAVKNAARDASGVLRAVPASGSKGDDYLALKKITRDLSTENIGNIDCVVIYKAGSADDDDASKNYNCNTCPITDECNRYDANQLRNLETLDFGDPGGPDHYWKPSARVRVLYPDGPDYAGIFVRMRFGSPTGMFPTPNHITSRFVGQLDATSDHL